MHAGSYQEGRETAEYNGRRAGFRCGHNFDIFLQVPFWWEKTSGMCTTCLHFVNFSLRCVGTVKAIC